MKTDASSLLRLGHAPARFFLAAIIVTEVALAIPTLGVVKSPWPVFAALALFTVGAIVMAQPHPDPFPLGLSLLALAIAVAVTALAVWNFPDRGWPGYASWNFGAVSWLLFFLIFRGRLLLGWLGLGLVAAVTVSWAVLIGRGYLNGADFVVRHAGTLLMGMLFSILLQRTSARITALRQEQVAQAATEAAGLTELREREVQARQLTEEARGSLEEIARGQYLDPVKQRHYELVEASLRDTLRGGGLKTPAVAAAVQRARMRGAVVVLLDDRNDPLDAATAAAVEAALAHELDSLHDGSLTVRLLPGGRDIAATIVRNQAGSRRRTDIPSVL